LSQPAEPASFLYSDRRTYVKLNGPTQSSRQQDFNR
jgi:hypothetical protein